MKRIYTIFLDFFIFFVSLFFISCASNTMKSTQKTPTVYVTNSSKVHILTTENILKNIDEVQLFEGAFGDKKISMPFYIQADTNKINVSFLNDFGTSMAELIYSNNVVEFNSLVFPSDIKAEYMIWDIQLAFYNATEIEKQLKKSRLEFIVEFYNDAETRKIFDGKKLIQEVIIKENYIQVQNILRGYNYHLVGVSDE